MADEKLFTQEEVNKLVGAARLEGKDAVRKEYEGWISPEEFSKKTEDLNVQLNGLNDQIKTLTDEKTAFKTQLSEKDEKIAKYEIDSVKTKIAKEFGLSWEAKDYLQGEDEEAIRDSAKGLKKLVGSGSPAPAFNPEPARDTNSKDAAFRSMLQDLNGGR